MTLVERLVLSVLALACERALLNQRADRARDTSRASQDRPVKRCSCGYLHTRGEWEMLPLVGTQEDGDDRPLELRNCSACGSTISVERAVPPRWWAIEPRTGMALCPCVRTGRDSVYARAACWACAGAGVLSGTLVRVPVTFEEWADGAELKGSAVVQLTTGSRGDRESPPEPPSAHVLGVELLGEWLPPEEAADLLPVSEDRDEALSRWETRAWELCPW